MRRLQKNSKISNRKLSDDLPKVSHTTVGRRIKRLENEGIIKGYTTIVDHQKLGEFIALVHVVITTETAMETIRNLLVRCDNVLDVYIITGRYDLLAKVKVENTAQLYDFIFGKGGLRESPGIERTETMIVLNLAKESGIQF